MTLFIDLCDEELEKILLGDRGMDLLTEKVLNQILQAEMTDHLGAGRYERSEERTGYRNGSYEQKLTTRVGTIELEVPRDRPDRPAGHPQREWGAVEYRNLKIRRPLE